MKPNRLFLVGSLTLLCGSFLSQAALPIAATTGASNITASAATLHGTVTPRSAKTKTWFEWGITTNYGHVTATQVLAAGSAAIPAQQTVGGLAPLTTYHFRTVAKNAYGTRRGTDEMFTTLPPPPVAQTLAATNIGTFGATLAGIASPNAAVAASVYFEYGRSTNYGFQSATQILAGGSINIYVTARVSNMLDGVDYHYRLVVITNSTLVYGNNQAFQMGTTLAEVQVLNATNLSGGGATLQALVTPNSVFGSTIAYFEYGTSTNYGNGPFGANVPAGIAASLIQMPVTNLAPVVLYHFRAYSYKVQTGERVYGADRTFTTLRIPTVATGPANVVSNTVTLNATVNPNGAAASVQFEWGLTTAYGNLTPVQIVPTGTNLVAVSGTIGPLAPNLYHFRIVATTATGSTAGADQLFGVQNDTEIVLNSCAEEDFRFAFLTNRTVRFTSDCVINLTSPLIVASEKILDATGHSVVLSGGNSNRIFEVQSNGSLSLIHLTISNGLKRGSNGIRSALSSDYNGESGSGGAVTVASGSLAAFACVFADNAVTGGHAGTNDAGGFGPLSGGGSASGGAIYANASSITFSNCVFDGNYGVGGNGGVIASSHFNPPGNVFGGAIFAEGGELLLLGCSFTNNRASGRGGGGAVWCQTTNFQVRDSRFMKNTAQTGGAIRDQSAYSHISNCSFTANAAVGAPYNRATASLAPGYGGAYFHSAGTSVMSVCFFAFNSAIGAEAGQGAFTSRWASSGFGGAVAHLAGNLVLTRSLLVSNSAKGGDHIIFVPTVGALGNGSGGAIYIAANSAITNCTLSANRAIGGLYMSFGAGQGIGGGLSVESGTAAIHFCTIAENSAESRADNIASIPHGGGMSQSNGATAIANSIFSQNKTNTAFENVNGAVADLGHNISSDPTPGWTSGTSLNNTDPLLLPLANNGGSTPTRALNIGSPALNNADCASAPPTDQRGFSRPNGLGCDIGAYEGPGVPAAFITRENSGTNVIRAVSEPGRSYRLEQTTSFNGWTALATNNVPQNGFIEFRVLADQSTRFFRVVAD